MKWTRKELKERAKEALRRNYWKAVFVSFIFIVLGGGVNSSASSPFVNNGKGEKENNLVLIETDALNDDGDFVQTGDDGESSNGSHIVEMLNNIGDSVEESLDNLGEARVAVIVAFAAVMVITFIIAMIIGLAIDVFLVNPLWVGP